MLRLTIVSLAALTILPGIAASLLEPARVFSPRLAAVGMSVGLAAGIVYFFLALASGGGMINARLVRDPDRPHDPNAAISMGLGAAGVASAAVVNLEYPVSFRTFYALCALAGLAIAVVNAYRYRLQPPVDGSQ